MRSAGRTGGDDDDDGKLRLWIVSGGSIYDDGGSELCHHCCYEVTSISCSSSASHPVSKDFARLRQVLFSLGMFALNIAAAAVTTAIKNAALSTAVSLPAVKPSLFGKNS